MKLILSSFVILIILITGGILLYNTDTNDKKARNDAIKVTAQIKKLRCKQRLKSDKSLVVVSYQQSDFSFFVSEDYCNQFKVGQSIEVYFSATYNKLFLNN